MGDRSIKQPNGLYARFSSVVDDFTHYNHTREELYEVFCDMCGCHTANEKMKRAELYPGRFDEAIDTVKLIHGSKIAKRRVAQMSKEVLSRKVDE